VTYILHERELGSAEVNTDSQGNATYDFTVPSPGSIYVKAIVDENGRQIVNRGGSFWAPEKRASGQTSSMTTTKKERSTRPRQEILPTRRDCSRAGDVTQGQRAPAGDHGTLGSPHCAHIDAPGRSIVIDVPIDKRYAPNVISTWPL
jgi:hypothetical protein